MTTPTHDYGRVCLEDLAPLKDVLRNTPAQEDAHKEMVASLRAHGLLQPLVVRKEEECYRVIGGNRRFAALKELAAEGAIAPDAMVACTIEEIDDTEAVLAENTVRVAMHPADQAVAFAEIAGQGASEDDIGVRFGLSKRTVQRRLRLGRLAPEILEAYRVGEIETDIAQAYASTSNAERQLTVFKVLQAQSQHHGYYGGVNNVMQQLQKDSMRSDSPLAKFVGSKRYHDAGGQSEATLWDDYSVFSDIDLLQRLAKEKFERIAKRIAKDGWKWVEYSVDRDNQRTIRDKCTSLFPEQGQPTAAEAAIFDAAEKFDKKYADYEDDLPADAEAEHTRLSEQYAEALEAVHDRRSFTPEQMAASGVLLFFQPPRQDREDRGPGEERRPGTRP